VRERERAIVRRGEREGEVMCVCHYNACKMLLVLVLNYPNAPSYKITRGEHWGDLKTLPFFLLCVGYDCPLSVSSQESKNIFAFTHPMGLSVCLHERNSDTKRERERDYRLNILPLMLTNCLALLHTHTHTHTHTQTNTGSCRRAGQGHDG
jgi:hypothetical protein